MAIIDSGRFGAIVYRKCVNINEIAYEVDGGINNLMENVHQFFDQKNNAYALFLHPTPSFLKMATNQYNSSVPSSFFQDTA